MYLFPEMIHIGLEPRQKLYVQALPHQVCLQQRSEIPQLAVVSTLAKNPVSVTSVAPHLASTQR